MPPPLLSIVVPCYNQQTLIERTLRSLNHIADERRPDVEVVVVDDGSTDDSLAVIRSYIERRPTGHQWRILHQENGGVGAARNAAFRAARGRWLYMLDGDDELAADPTPHLPAEGATCAAFAIERASPRRTETLRPPAVASRARLYDLLTAASPFFNCSLVFRADCLDQHFDERLAYLEDWKFWIENPRIFDRLVAVDLVLARYHIHRRNRTAHFARTGASRRQVARFLLESDELPLTRRQRNNAVLQDAIGSLLEGSGMQWKALLAAPCSPVLAAKLGVYFLLRGRIHWVHPFG